MLKTTTPPDRTSSQCPISAGRFVRALGGGFANTSLALPDRARNEQNDPTAAINGFYTKKKVSGIKLSAVTSSYEFYMMFGPGDDRDNCEPFSVGRR